MKITIETLITENFFIHQHSLCLLAFSNLLKIILTELIGIIKFRNDIQKISRDLSLLRSTLSPTSGKSFQFSALIEFQLMSTKIIG